jgi:hypothetical protein
MPIAESNLLLEPAIPAVVLLKCLLPLRLVQQAVPHAAVELLAHRLHTFFVQLHNRITQPMQHAIRGANDMIDRNYNFIILIVLFFSNCMYYQKKNSTNPALVLLINYNNLLSTSTTSTSISSCDSTKSYNFNSGIPDCWTSSWPTTTSFCPTGGDSLCLATPTIANSSFINAQFKATTNSGSITFQRRVSSESGFDFCSFKVDGVSQEGNGASGTTDGLVSFSISAGTHTFLWTYSKDSSTSSGSDRCAIDNVTIP